MLAGSCWQVFLFLKERKMKKASKTESPRVNIKKYFYA